MLCCKNKVTYLHIQINTFFVNYLIVVSDMPVCAVLWEWRVQAGPVEVEELYNPPMI